MHAQERTQGNRTEADRVNIVGEVVNAQGQPIEGIDITVGVKDGADKGRIVARERTNKFGEYTFECLDRDLYQVSLSSKSIAIPQGETTIDVRQDGAVLDWRGSQGSMQPSSHFLDTCCRQTPSSEAQGRTDERGRATQNSTQRERASLGGVVLDTERRPVPGVEIQVRNRQDAIVARVVSNDKGEYLLPCLVQENYALTLDPQKTPFQGKTTIVHVGTGGVVVNWRVSQVTQAIVTLHRGTCCGAAVAWYGLPALILGGGGAAGVGAAVAIDSNPRRRPESPSQ